MTDTQAPAQRDAIARTLATIVASATEHERLDEHSWDLNLVELGASSLMITQIRGSIRACFGVELQSAHLFAADATIRGLAERIASHPDRRFEPEPEPRASRPVQARAPGTADAELAALLSEQLRTFEALTRQQLELVQRLGRGLPKQEPEPAKPKPEPGSDTPSSPGVFVPFKAIERAPRAPDASDPRLSELVEAYQGQTSGTRDKTERDRPVFANNRNIIGFKRKWKEMAYQLIAARAQGSKIWDVDGHEYIDLTSGFGSSMFGHSPAFIVEAIQAQLARSYAVGPISDLAGEVARRLCGLTGHERVAFYNSGTEAVMVALRLARTATGRAKVVIFQGSYHGTFDGVMAIPPPGDPGGPSIPMAPGVPDSFVADTIVLRYDDPASLELIRARAHELAAVLVEPVQSRRPDLQPRAFLHELRAITAASGTALIFDEVVTGFRVGAGGAQAMFGVQADLATYGKVVGGGMPVGIVAGQRAFMDGVDGGVWRFGDDSVPDQTNTFVAGTFCSHPLSMAATLAVLERIEREGPALYEGLERRTRALCAALDDIFRARGLPIRMAQLGSLFRFVLRGDYELLFYKLVTKGVYVWEGRGCFVTTAHDDADLARVVEAVRESVDELFPPSAALARAARVPASFEQARMFGRCAVPDGNQNYHTRMSFWVEGQLELDRFAAALDELVERHEVLRTSFEREQEAVIQAIHARAKAELIVAELRDEPQAIAAFVERLAEPMALTRLSLMRVGLGQLESGRQLLVFVIHHLVTDGLSMDLIVDELVRLYEGETLAPPARQFREFVRWERAYLDSPAAARDRQFWLDALTEVPALELPNEGRGRGGFRSHGLRLRLAPELDRAMRDLARSEAATFNMLLLTVYGVLLARLSGAHELCIGGPASGRPDEGFEQALGMFMGAIVYRVDPDPDKTLRGLLREVKAHCVRAYEAQHYPFPLVMSARGNPPGANEGPPYTAGFSYEEFTLEPVRSATLTLTRRPSDKGTLSVDLILRALGDTSPMALHFVSNAELIAIERLRSWAELYLELCTRLVAEPDAPLAAVLDAGSSTLAVTA